MLREKTSHERTASADFLKVPSCADADKYNDGVAQERTATTPMPAVIADAISANALARGSNRATVRVCAIL